MDLRTSGAEDAVPVTARKLEALVRLAEASARIRLSQKVETRDSKRAIKVTKSSLENVSRDPEKTENDIGSLKHRGGVVQPRESYLRLI